MKHTHALPGFAALKAHYPTALDSPKVRRDVGGEATASWVGENTCVLRMSKAFNYAGKDYAIPGNHDGLLTVVGADKMNYAIRVLEFINYLHTTYRSPDIVRVGSQIAAEAFGNKTGIITWHINGWSNARGHFTLWDGTRALFQGPHDYFRDFPTHRTSNAPWIEKVEFWTC